MKNLRILLLIMISYNLYSAEIPKIDPFTFANELYGASNWTEAYIKYNAIHNDINTGKLKSNEIDLTALVRGHVNFGDVTFAKAASEYSNGNKDEAKKLMLQACSHWSFRLQGGQFGRKPLNNEWDGSDLTGKTLVVYSERDGGAFGDTFYMTDLLRYVKEKGAQVIFVPQKPLANLYDKTKLPNALQTQYIDQVALRGTELPKHDKATYLWSILEHYVNDKKIEKPFPMKPCLSGTQFSHQPLLQKIEELTQKYGQEPFLVGMWWRSAGPAAMAADWRTLDRDPGAHRMLSTVEGLPVLVINLEGMGRKPLSEEELKNRRANGTQGHSDEVDVTTYPTDNVFSFGSDFDKDIAFGDTLGVMGMIKKRRGVLIGCDTGLCNAAAMVEKDEEEYPEESVLAILNKKADHRWSDSLISPRKWHHSDDVLVFQAQKQGKWDDALLQARQVIMNRIQLFLKHKN